MRTMTIIRVVAWLSFVVVMWALGATWGSDAATGSGPPHQWKQEVAGAIIFVGLAALLLSISGPRGKRRWLTRGFAAMLAAAAIFIVLSLRDNAMQTFPDLIEGDGWQTLAIGVGIAFGNTVIALLLPAPKRVVKVGSKKARRRRTKR